MPVDWSVLESCSQFEHKVDTSVSRLVVCDMVFGESCVQLEQFLGTDLGLYQITINKSAYFLIVTRPNPHFSRILAENRLYDQKNGCFLDRNLFTASASPKLR